VAEREREREERKTKAEYTQPQESKFTDIQNLEQSNAKVYPEVSGLAAWSENRKWYSSLQLGVVVSLFCESV
jgi:hypothetical protein